jgi:hypothetical protein
MHQLNSGDRDACIPEAFEAKHHVDSGLDLTMILFDQVVQVL